MVSAIGKRCVEGFVPDLAEACKEVTCLCGHVKAEHQFNRRFCYQCSYTRYRPEIEVRSMGLI